MTISALKVKRSSRRLRLSAELSSTHLSKTWSVWFEINQNQASLVTPEVEVFLPVALVMAMRLDEDLELDSPIKTDVRDSLYRVMNLVTSWRPTDIWPQLHRVKIKAPPAPLPREVLTSAPKRGAFFSLGLDSFYALRKMEEETDTKLSYLILVHGFDIDLDNKTLFETARGNAQAVADQTGKELVVISTNLKTVMEETLGWDAAHGAGLTAVAYFLSGGLETVYINSGDKRSATRPYGTRFDLDRLWSTKNLTVTTSGVGLTRLQKLRYLQDDSLTQRYLRVCWKNPNNAYNCSRCPKCLGTMLLIRILGASRTFTTFSPKINPHDLSHVVEPLHRIFWWNDAFLRLPLSDVHIRLQIMGIWWRSLVRYLDLEGDN